MSHGLHVLHEHIFTINQSRRQEATIEGHRGNLLDGPAIECATPLIVYVPPAFRFWEPRSAFGTLESPKNAFGTDAWPADPALPESPSG
jgi:hypothetical protein